MAGAAPVLGEPGSVVSWWLMPSSEDLQQLQELIDRTAARLGSPSFAPHVTLLGGVPVEGDEQVKELLLASHRLAGELPPLELVCRDVLGFEPWNQFCLATIDCRELAEANVRAQRRLRPGAGEPSGAAFAPPVGLPHLSLAYAECPSTEERAAAVAAVKAEEGGRLEGFRFRATSLSMWHTSGGFQGIPTWRKIADFPLAGS
mmetsp:Transcript_45842/g.147217  ORF Transcript_45842/g.147217 Transcript_45842/m.147217 type:complete len:203 (-) Transcript_45842:214-822(-)